MSHLAVPKTYKLYLGGKFPRSESGRTYPLRDADGRLLANAARASRKDARDAVVAARKGFAAWSGATPYNRGQVIYRIAEMLDGRRAEFVDLLTRGGSARRRPASRSTPPWTGWCTTRGGPTSCPPSSGRATRSRVPTSPTPPPNPPAWSALLAPAGAPLLGLVSVIGPIIAGGNACVVVAAEADAYVAVTFGEVLATSDVPAGWSTCSPGRAAEIAPHLAAHADVDALDLTGADAELGDRARAGRGGDPQAGATAPRAPDFAADPGLGRLRAFLETKTVWHPTGALSLAGGSAY